ncbi:MAG TPA: hypothetical protein VNW52_12340, partial [Burkholderiaceae bacterium]|nr:hypothetical protein [Burkholderiaceae bacterium]
TPNATIGIRGTDHEPVVVVEPPAGTVVNNPAGTYDKVNVGATSLTTQAGTAIIGPNQVGYAASPTQAPVLLPRLPNFYQATPTPSAKADQKQQAANSSQGSTESASSSTNSGSSSSSSSSTASTTDTKTDVTASPAVAPISIVPVASLTGVNANGNTLNLSEQTLTSSTGQVQTLSNDTTISSGSSGSSSSGSGSTSTGGSGTPLASNAGNLLIISFPYTQSSGSTSFTVPEYYSLGGSGLGLTNDASGNLTAASFVGSPDSSVGSGGDYTGYHASLSQSGSTLTNFGSNAATGLSWGRWQGGTITQSYQYYGQDASGNQGIGAQNASGAFVIGATQSLSTTLGSSSLHWITGPVPVIGFLPQVLTGTATYTLIGGTNPTDQNGNIGTLNKADLGVNFTTQLVNAKVDFTVAGNNWTMQSSNMALDGIGFSSTSNCNNGCTGSASITRNGTPISSTPVATSASTPIEYALGSLSGYLTGNGLNGAALEYLVQDIVTSVGATNSTVTSTVAQGVAAFSGPTQNVNTQFSAVAIVDGWNNLSKQVSGNGSSNTGTVFNYGPFYHGNVEGSEQSPASVVASSAGLTSFIGSAAGYTPANSSVTVPAAGNNNSANVINVGTATNTNLGSASVGGVTVSWGRWAGGNVNIYSLDGTTLLGSIDNSNRSIHWANISSLTATALTMPLTGTASYTVVGNTDPTDFKGNTGTLTSATLNADFANAKVNTSINVSFNSSTNTSTWNLTADNVPLSGGGFKSDSTMNGVNGVVNTVTCTGSSCGTTSNGYVQGHFVAGAQGALMLYGMNTGSTANSTSSSGASISTFTPSNGATGLIVMKH